MRKTIRDESGMTLLELTFASGVMAMTLSFLFGSLMTMTVTGDVTASRAVTTTHLTSVMEELRGLSYEQLLSYTPPTFSNRQPGEVVQVSCVKADGTLVTLPANPTGLALPNPVTVQCTVTWRDSKGHLLTRTISQQYRR